MPRSVLSCWSRCHKAGLQQQVSEKASSGLLFFLFRRKHHFTSISVIHFLSDSKNYTDNRFTIINLHSQLACCAHRKTKSFAQLGFFFAAVHTPIQGWAHPYRGTCEEPLLSKQPLGGKTICSTKAITEGTQRPRTVAVRDISSFSIPLQKWPSLTADQACHGIP